MVSRGPAARSARSSRQSGCATGRPVDRPPDPHRPDGDVDAHAHKVLEGIDDSVLHGGGMIVPGSLMPSPEWVPVSGRLHDAVKAREF